MTAAGHSIAEYAVHHAFLDGKVNYGLLFPVVYARKFGLFALFLYHLHFLHKFGGDVLRSKLRVVQEEGFAGDGDLGDGLSVTGDGAVF